MSLAAAGSPTVDRVRPREPDRPTTQEDHVTQEPRPSVAQPHRLDHTFTAPIEKDGAFATYVTVTGSAELLGTRRAVKVAGTIDGHEFEATLMPSGVGPHWLPLRAALTRRVGKSEAGELVTVHLAQRRS